MGYLPHYGVVRGEIDNRVKGTVRGEIWVMGQARPITLELEGNACPDVAGCLLKFTNPGPREPDAEWYLLHAIQCGLIGDITASQKMRAPHMTGTKWAFKPGEKIPPLPMANGLHVEWFSDFNGRLVLQTVDFNLEISEPEWRMTPEENLLREKQAAEGMDLFMRRLTDEIEGHQKGRKDPNEKWDEHDYEKFLKECDARAAKYIELRDKSYFARGKLRSKWRQEARQEEYRIFQVKEACIKELSHPRPHSEQRREGIDWIRTKNGVVFHPLYLRCRDSAFEYYQFVLKQEMDKRADKDLSQFITGFLKAAGGLQDALQGFAEGRVFADNALIVAHLKRALNHLHKSQAGLEAVAPKKILPATTVANARKELFEIRESILKLMDEFRGRNN